jgi:uncharacterized membrane protein SirB2
MKCARNYTHSKRYTSSFQLWFSFLTSLLNVNRVRARKTTGEMIQWYQISMNHGHDIFYSFYCFYMYTRWKIILTKESHGRWILHNLWLVCVYIIVNYQSLTNSRNDKPKTHYLPVASFHFHFYSQHNYLQWNKNATLF